MNDRNGVAAPVDTPDQRSKATDLLNQIDLRRTSGDSKKQSFPDCIETTWNQERTVIPFCRQHADISGSMTGKVE